MAGNISKDNTAAEIDVDRMSGGDTGVKNVFFSYIFISNNISRIYT